MEDTTPRIRAWTTRVYFPWRRSYCFFSGCLLSTREPLLASPSPPIIWKVCCHTVTIHWSFVWEHSIVGVCSWIAIFRGPACIYCRRENTSFSRLEMVRTSASESEIVCRETNSTWVTKSCGMSFPFDVPVRWGLIVSIFFSSRPFSYNRRKRPKDVGPKFLWRFVWPKKLELTDVDLFKHPPLRMRSGKEPFGQHPRTPYYSSC